MSEGTKPNLLYYGDNIDILRRYVEDESVDLVYLDPPLNTNADYSGLFAEKSGEKAHAQLKTFEDTWEWGLEAAQEYTAVLLSGHDRVANALKGMNDFLADNAITASMSMAARRSLNSNAPPRCRDSRVESRTSPQTQYISPTYIRSEGIF